MKIKKILITGSSGTIGTRLCEKLLGRNYDIFGIDWKSNKWNDRLRQGDSFRENNGTKKF